MDDRLRQSDRAHHEPAQSAAGDGYTEPLTVQQGWTALHPVLTSFLSGITGAGLVALAANTWITARVKGGIDAQYARALETLKVQLGSEAYARLEVHKADLKRSGDAEIEKLRSQLAAANTERTTLLAALTTRRFEAIAAVPAAVVNFDQALKAMTAGFQTADSDPKARVQAVVDESVKFNAVFADRQIFLTEATADKVEHLRGALVRHAYLFQHTAMNPDAPDFSQRCFEIDQAVSGPIADALRDLQRELRALMGDVQGQRHA
jgi:hypothetical protein